MDNYVLGIDVGGTSVRIGLVNNENKVIEMVKHLSSEIAPKFREEIVNYFNNFKNKYNIIAVSIGFPGLVNDYTKEILNIPNQKLFETKDYIKELIEILNIPVYIDNDVNNLLLFDVNKFNLKDKNVLGFYIGTGFGNGIYLNNEIFVGDNNYAGEMGHIPIYGNELVCGCGKKGCLETLVSGVALLSIHNKYFKDTDYDEIFNNHINSPHIIKFIEMLASAIVTQIVMLDVNNIILGGGVIHKKGFPRKLLEDNIKKHLRSYDLVSKLKIYYSESLPEDGIIGASLKARLKMHF